MRYLYGLLVLLLLFSAVSVPSTALAASDYLEWQDIEKPGEDGNMVVSPSEISGLAAGQDDFIYVIDSANSGIYRSVNGGSVWSDITDNLDDEGAGLPATLIAVAPDDPYVVAVVTDGGTAVYLSTDAGEDWSDIGAPGDMTGTIQAIAISEEYTYSGDDYREIAIGTADWDDGTADGGIWVYQTGGYFVDWDNMNLEPAGEVSAIAYSPDYGDDTTIAVVTSTGDDTYLCLLDRESSNWNDPEDSSAGDFPVRITEAGYGSGVDGIYASLALPSDYSADDAASRQLLVSFNLEPGASGTEDYDDVYWLNNDDAERLNADGGAAIDICSLAYYGTIDSGVLLAGDVNPEAGALTVQVRRTDEPFDSSPDWDESSVPPTGPGNAQVGWSEDGETAYCGTGQLPGEALDESAFSSSLDGDKWRQMGLMDTVIELADIAITPDGEALFITTTSEYGPEGVWRTAGSTLGSIWERVLTMDTGSDTVILRLSPEYEDDYTIYAAEAGGSMIAVTDTRGNSWEWCHGDPGTIVDMAVVDEETVYVAVTGGYFRKSTNGITTWRQPVETKLDDINMMTVVDEDTILVGGQDGDVAYSTDGGDTFTKIMDTIGTGNVQVVADAGFAENGIIYAATDVADEGIWRWTIGESGMWEQIDTAVTDLGDGQCLGSLTVGPEGTLYALRTEVSSDTGGGVSRSLNPLETETEDVEFGLINQELEDTGASFDPAAVFANTMPYLKLYADDEYNELWTIDTANDTIYYYQDILCKTGPTATSPEPGETLSVDASGNIIRLTLGWEELEGATEYEAVIYGSGGLVDPVWTGTSEGTTLNTSRTDEPAELSSGTTYYWRVRASGPVTSPWSELGTINPGLGAGEWSPVAAPSGVSPLAGASDVSVSPTFSWQPADWATAYEFVLAGDSEFSDTLVSLTGAGAVTSTVWAYDGELEYATTYFWKVRAVSDSGQSEWGVSVFTTEAAPASYQPQSTSSTGTDTATTATPFYIYIIIGIGAALVILLLWLIIRTRQTV